MTLRTQGRASRARGLDGAGISLSLRSGSPGMHGVAQSTGDGGAQIAEVPLVPPVLVLLASALLLIAAGRGPDPRVVVGYAIVFLSVFGLVSLVYVPRLLLRRGGREAARRLALASASIAALLLFQSCFAALKALIGSTYPFRWDPFLATVDRALHGGRAPWQWLSPLVADPRVTRALVVFYNPGWLLLTATMITVTSWYGNAVWRFRFIVAYLLIWTMGGAVLAATVASAGPIFYGLVVPGRDPFAPFVSELLSASPLLSGLRTALWQGHLGTGAAYGISAWPSIHVATSTLYACAGWSWSRFWGVVLTLVAAGIVFGSVALGWHYAVGAYAGALLGIGAWLISKYVARIRIVFPR